MVSFPTASPFLGQQDDDVQIARLLADPACRLLTLGGPGDIGKTRLAFEAARQFFAHDNVQKLVVKYAF